MWILIQFFSLSTAADLLLKKIDNFFLKSYEFLTSSIAAAIIIRTNEAKGIKLTDIIMDTIKSILDDEQYRSVLCGDYEDVHNPYDEEDEFDEGDCTDESSDDEYAISDYESDPDELANLTADDPYEKERTRQPCQNAVVINGETIEVLTQTSLVDQNDPDQPEVAMECYSDNEYEDDDPAVRKMKKTTAAGTKVKEPPAFYTEKFWKAVDPVSNSSLTAKQKKILKDNQTRYIQLEGKLIRRTKCSVCMKATTNLGLIFLDPKGNENDYMVSSCNVCALRLVHDFRLPEKEREFDHDDVYERVHRECKRPLAFHNVTSLKTAEPGTHLEDYIVNKDMSIVSREAYIRDMSDQHFERMAPRRFTPKPTKAAKKKASALAAAAAKAEAASTSKASTSKSKASTSPKAKASTSKAKATKSKAKKPRASKAKKSKSEESGGDNDDDDNNIEDDDEDSLEM